MTRRHRTLTVALTCLLACGGVGLVPTMTPLVAAQQPVIHDDPLAPVANEALWHLTAYASTGEVTEGATYHDQLHVLATVIGERVDLDWAGLEQAWLAADVAHQKALMAALSQLGVPYRRNALAPFNGLDCSGLTSYAWAQAGLSLYHQSEVQINNSAPRSPDTAQAGDLVHYPGHVMLYLGYADAIVHAPHTGATVQVSKIWKQRSVRFGDPTG